MKEKRFHWTIVSALMFIISQSIQAQVPTNGLQLWLRADSADVVGANAAITKLYDLSGNNRHATQPNATSRPTRVVASNFGNRPVADFTILGDKGFQFPRVTTIRTVFMVVRSADTFTPQFLLGDSTTFDFHGGGNGTPNSGRMFDTNFAAASVKNGLMRYNGLKRAPSTLRPTEPTIVTIQTTGNASAGLLSFDRTFINRSWRGEIAEVLLYSDSLNTSQRRIVETYLAGRYNIALNNPAPPPRPIASEKLELWLRADFAQTDAGLRVSRMVDLSDQGREIFQNGATQRPQLVSVAGNFGNQAVMVFTPDGLRTLNFDRVANIRTVFMVASSLDTTSLQFMLGDATTFDFHGGGTGTGRGTLFDSVFASPNILNGSLFYNGIPRPTRTTLRPLVPTVIALQTTGNVAASRLSADRTLTGRSWRGVIAELLIFSDVLTTAQRDSVQNYLAQRYGVTLSTPSGNTDRQIKTFVLEQNYPNPFNPTTVVSYSLPSASEVKLEVFDVLGKKVATLVNQRQAAGSYSESFNAANLSSGVYFYRLQAGGFVSSKKMMLVK